MITKPFPDKWVRKMISEALNGMTIGTENVVTYDSRTAGSLPLNYVIMTTQTNAVDPASKCGDRWIHVIQLDIYNRVLGSRDTASRVSVDDIVNECINRFQNLSLDVSSNLKLLRYNMSNPADFVVQDGNYLLTRKIIQLRLLIN